VTTTPMPDLTWHEEAAKLARGLQVIVAAMVGGYLVYLLVTLVIGPQAKLSLPVLPLSLSSIAAVLVGVGFVARWHFLGWIARKARREIVNGTYDVINPRAPWGPVPLLPPEAVKASLGPCPDARYLIRVFRSRTIFGAGILEGWGMFAILAYLVDGNTTTLILAILVIFSIVASFPTTPRTIRWVERQLDSLAQTSGPH
jgi:hypothetical protein